jgi:fido (protein-threonine AMPylation protein)
MNTIGLIIESASNSQAKRIREMYNHHLDYANKVDIESMLSAMQTLTLMHPFKVGRGGNHVWISNLANERLAIITFKNTTQHEQ